MRTPISIKKSGETFDLIAYFNTIPQTGSSPSLTFLKIPLYDLVFLEFALSFGAKLKNFCADFWGTMKYILPEAVYAS